VIDPVINILYEPISQNFFGHFSPYNGKISIRIRVWSDIYTMRNSCHIS